MSADNQTVGYSFQFDKERVLADDWVSLIKILITAIFGEISSASVQYLDLSTTESLGSIGEYTWTLVNIKPVSYATKCAVVPYWDIQGRVEGACVV